MADENDAGEQPLWIVVRNWDKFQHYKNRNPPWIKLYLELHHDDNYMRLSGNRRAILTSVWVEYGLSQRCVPLDPKLLGRRFNLNVKMADLEALNHAGFIIFAASKPLAPRYQDASASRALARERDKEETQRQEQEQEQEGSNVIAKERRTPSFEASYEATSIALEQEREASRYVERDDAGQPFKIREMQTLGGNP